MLLQFQFTQFGSEEEYEIIPDFCEWLGNQMFEYINTKINRKKIELRINYLYKVPWIKWATKSSYIDVEMIMKAIYQSITFEEYRNNLWKINIDENVLIPNTYTSISRLVRFINYGDNKTRATGMFTNLVHKFNHMTLNNLWRIYATNRLGYFSQIKIITE